MARAPDLPGHGTGRRFGLCPTGGALDPASGAGTRGPRARALAHPGGALALHSGLPDGRAGQLAADIRGRGFGPGSTGRDQCPDTGAGPRRAGIGGATRRCVLCLPVLQRAGAALRWLHRSGRHLAGERRACHALPHSGFLAHPQPDCGVFSGSAHRGGSVGTQPTEAPPRPTHDPAPVHVAHRQPCRTGFFGQPGHCVWAR